MNTENTKFSGFIEPRDNFYCLPNWIFVFLTKIIGDFPIQRSSILGVLEYLLKWNFRIENRKTKHGLSSKEICKGYTSGKIHEDKGTGLNPRTISKVLTILIELNIVIQSSVERKSYYRINEKIIHSTKQKFPIMIGKETLKFSDISKGYFKVPNWFTDCFCQKNDFWLRTVILYLFRHTWGYQNQSGVWLEIDDFSKGRKDIDGGRYDSGIGNDEASIFKALNEARELGWIVWTDRHYGEYSRRLFNLRFPNSVVSDDNEFLGQLPWEDDIDYQNWKDENKILRSIQDRNEKNIFHRSSSQKNGGELCNYLEAELVPKNNQIACENENISCQVASNACEDANISCQNVNKGCENVVITCENNQATCDNVKNGCTNVVFSSDKETYKKDTNEEIEQKTKETISPNDTIDDEEILSSAFIAGSQYHFLHSNDITSPMLDKICLLKMPDEDVFAWILQDYADFNRKTILESKGKSSENIKLTHGCVVNRLRDRDEPSPKYIKLARLKIWEWIELCRVFTSFEYQHDPEQFIDISLMGQVPIFREIYGRDVFSLLPPDLSKFLKDLLLKEKNYE